jgi:hypothetical protein
MEAWKIIGMALVVCFVIVLPMCNSGSEKRTDGVFESATKKMDSGRTDQMTNAEKQRVHDILNWCKICNKPLRSCPHGK